MADRRIKKPLTRREGSTNQTKQQPEPTTPEVPVEDQAPQPPALDIERREQENDATKANMTKSHLTDAAYEEVDFSSLPNAPKDSIILGPNENLVVDGDLSSDGTTLKLSKAVYRAFLPMGSKRWAFTLEYPLGAEIPASMVIPADKKNPPTATSPEAEEGSEEDDDSSEENDENDSE